MVAKNQGNDSFNKKKTNFKVILIQKHIINTLITPSNHSINSKYQKIAQNLKLNRISFCYVGLNPTLRFQTTTMKP
jgi:hypothetical protein